EAHFLLKPRARDPKLDDRIAFRLDQVLHFLPAWNVDSRELPAVRLYFVLQFVDAVHVSDTGTRLHTTDILVRNPLDVSRGRTVRIAGIRHARVDSDGDNELLHDIASSSPSACGRTPPYP